MKQDIEAKTRQIMDSILTKEKAKVQMKLDNIEVYHNKAIKHINIQIAKATTYRQKKIWNQKLAEYQDLEAYKSYLLDQLESYM